MSFVSSSCRPFRTLRFARAFSACVLLVAVAAGCEKREVATADAASLRTTGQGQVVGYVGDYGSHVWRGIPYAAPPVGDDRWRARNGVSMPPERGAYASFDV